LKIAIIGGGICGLTTAFYLKRFSPTSSITVFETENGFGGKLKTVHKYGFSIEIGANGFSEKDTEFAQLLKDAGLEHLIIQSLEISKTKYFFDRGSLYTLPSTLSELLQTKAIGALSKARLLMEFILPKKKTDDNETLQKFCAKRIGTSGANLFCDLAATATFASTADKLSANAAFKEVVDIEKAKGGLLKNIFSTMGIGETKIGFNGGVSSFIDELSKSFAFTKKLDTEVIKVKRMGAKWLIETANGNTEEFDKVILSTPSYVSSRLLKEEDEILSELLKTIEYSPLAVVALGYEELDHSMNGYGLITTKRSGTQALGIIWDSSIFKECVQNNTKLLRVVIGGQRSPLLALKKEDELLRIATGAISETMGVYEEPMLNHITRWHKAIPNYGVGHSELVKQIFDRASKASGLYLNSSAFKGISLNDCIKNSKETALKIISE